MHLHAAHASPTLNAGKARLHLAVLIMLVVLLRLPFLHQAVGGDDVYYLASAYHGLIDPSHPNHTFYVFEGRDVNFQGYPHPPGNAWVLTALLALYQDVYELPFHAAYLLFSVLAICGMYALARRFSPAPLWAAALFAVVPAFLINGNSFESDLPLLAFWLAGAAAFVYGVDRDDWRLLALSGCALACSALVAMQSVLFTPILLAYLALRPRPRKWRYALVAVIPLITLAGWQFFERLTSGQFPAAVATGYMSSYGLYRWAMKLRNVAALSIHSGFIVFPILLPFVIRDGWRSRRDPDTRFLLLWIGLFLLGAFVLFFSGSARYLLPMAAPVAILASRAPLNWVRAGFAAQLAISFGLAVVNFQHWNAYRVFAENLRGKTRGARVWVDAEWGLRHYLEADGALPLHRDQWIPTGDIVVESELAFPAPYRHGGRELVPIAQTEIRPWLPLRLIGLDAQSGYSTASAGLLPFDFRGGAIDRVRAVILHAREPALSRLPMGAPEAETQILYGVFSAENAAWRWTGEKAGILLKNVGHPATLYVNLYIADAAAARAVRVSLPGGPEKTLRAPGAGTYEVSLPVDIPGKTAITVQIDVDRTFSPPGDSRKLGIILNEVGLRDRR